MIGLPLFEILLPATYLSYMQWYCKHIQVGIPPNKDAEGG